MATSRVPVETHEQGAEGTFLISSSRPSLIIPWELNIEVGWDTSESVSFLFDVEWEGVEGDPMLEATMVDARGQPGETGSGADQIVVVCVRDCVGQGHVAIDWPAEFAEGEARVTWDGGADIWVYEAADEEVSFDFAVGDPLDG